MPEDFEMRIQKALDELRKGNFIIMTDENREKEADLVYAAKFSTEEKVSEFLHYVGAGGLFCVAMTPEQIESLKIPWHDPNSTNPSKTNFTKSVDPLKGTGINAYDRNTVVKYLIDAAYTKLKIGKGHTFPLRADPSGVFGRSGHTEGSIDIVKFAEIEPLGAVIQEIFYTGNNKEKWGKVLWADSLQKFANKMSIPVVSIDDVYEFKRKHYNATNSP